MKKKLNLYIFDYVKKHQKLPPHKESEKSKYAYHCRKLQEEGLIEKVGYGVWMVKQVQKQVQKNKHPTSEKLRSHGYRFELLLPKISNWNNRVKFLVMRDISFQKINGGQIVKCRRHNVYLYDNHIYVTFYKGKSINGSDPDENNHKAIIEFKKTMASLSRKLKTDFKVDNYYMFNCHHAAINNLVAKWHYDRGINKFEIKDKDGKVWLLMDNSFNLLELETVGKQSTKDMKTIVLPFMRTLKENPDFLKDLARTQEKQVKEIHDMIKSLAYLQKTSILDIKLINNKLQRMGYD